MRTKPVPGADRNPIIPSINHQPSTINDLNHFAGIAMHALLLSRNTVSPEIIAAESYKYAAAMLKFSAGIKSSALTGTGASEPPL